MSSILARRGPPPRPHRGKDARPSRCHGLGRLHGSGPCIFEGASLGNSSSPGVSHQAQRPDSDITFNNPAAMAIRISLMGCLISRKCLPTNRSSCHPATARETSYCAWADQLPSSPKRMGIMMCVSAAWSVACWSRLCPRLALNLTSKNSWASRSRQSEVSHSVLQQGRSEFYMFVSTSGGLCIVHQLCDSVTPSVDQGHPRQPLRKRLPGIKRRTGV